jgi:hypothetical protein
VRAAARDRHTATISWAVTQFGLAASALVFCLARHGFFSALQYLDDSRLPDHARVRVRVELLVTATMMGRFDVLPWLAERASTRYQALGLLCVRYRELPELVSGAAVPRLRQRVLQTMRWLAARDQAVPGYDDPRTLRAAYYGARPLRDQLAAILGPPPARPARRRDRRRLLRQQMRRWAQRWSQCGEDEPAERP